MIVFLLMTCALLVVIFALHWKCLPLVFRTPVATVLRRASLAFLVLTILGLVLGPLVWQDLTGLPGVLLRIAAIGAVVQVLLVLLTCFGWLFRRLAGLTGPVHVDYGRRRLLRHAGMGLCAGGRKGSGTARPRMSCCAVRWPRSRSHRCARAQPCRAGRPTPCRRRSCRSRRI